MISNEELCGNGKEVESKVINDIGWPYPLPLILSIASLHPFNLFPFSLMSSFLLPLLLLPLSLCIIPPLREQDDLFLNDFSDITPNRIPSPPQQNVPPASTQNEEFSLPEVFYHYVHPDMQWSFQFTSSSKTMNRQRIFHNGPPGWVCRL